MFREYKKDQNSNFIANYIISIIESLMNFNYSAINKILNMLNGFPELLLVIFGPIIIGILSFFVLIAQNIYMIYLWFANLSWFFKTNVNNYNSNEPKWENVTITDPINYGIAVALTIGFIILFFFSMPVLFFISFLTFAYCTLSCITYKGEMSNKTIYAGKIILDLFKYYKLPIMVIFSLFVISNAFSKLGTASGIFSIITLIGIYFGFIAIDLFNPVEKENMSPLVSFDQAKKRCIGVEQVKKTTGFFASLFKGGGITKEIKTASKIFNNK
jgi:hypothetical protein